MAGVTAVLRLVAVVGVLAGSALLVPVLAVLRGRARSTTVRALARALLAALGVRLERARSRRPAGQPARGQPRLLARRGRVLAAAAPARLVAKREVRGWPAVGRARRRGRDDLRGPVPAPGAAGDGGRGRGGAAGRQLGRGLPGGYDLLRCRPGAVPAGDVPGGGRRGCARRAAQRRLPGGWPGDAGDRVPRRRHPLVLDTPGVRRCAASP